MSEPLNNIRQAILDNGKPTEERRELPNYFEALCPEDYAHYDGLGVSESKTTDKRYCEGDGQTELKKKSDLSNVPN